MKLVCEPEFNDCTAGEMPALVRWYEKVILAAIIFIFLADQIRTAALRPFWFDELCSLVFSSLPTVKEMLRALPADGNPPLFFLLGRLCLHLPVHAEIALRLPSMIAIDITALMIYIIVRRNTGCIFSFFAMSIFLGCPFTHYAALDARPYALLLCFTGGAICFWQSAARGMHRRWALAGIAVCTAGAIFTHHYGVIYVTLPLAAGECVRAWHRRRLDYPVFAAILAGALSLFLTFPPMFHGQAGLLQAVKNCPVFWARPVLKSWWAYYSHATPSLISIYVFLALIFGAFLKRAAYNANRVSKEHIYLANRVCIEDLAAGSALIMVLPVMLLVTKLSTGYFTARYVMGSSLGVAIVFGMLLSLWNERWPEIKAFIVVGVVYCLLTALPVFWPVGPESEAARVQADPIYLSTPAQEPIVIADAIVFWPTWWYSDSSTRARLHYLSDLRYAVNQPDFLPEYALTLEQPYGVPKLDNYRDFLNSHGRFLLFSHRMPRLEWTINRLCAEGWRLTPIATSSRNILYQVDRP
jgi:uncharacterized membrane protein